MKKLRAWMSYQVEKNSSRVVLTVILLFNLVFLMLAALVISRLAPDSLKYHGFWYSVFYTVSMVLDAGCISYVVENVGQTSVALIIVCLLVVIAGMIIFTGAVIGYITNYISTFIENSNSGTRKLKLSGHTVILNWNSRASEIVNDLIYNETPETVIVLVPGGKDIIEKEVEERLAETVATEKVKNKVRFVVREGETFSVTKLNEISIKNAKSVIILANPNYDHMGQVKKNNGIERRGNYSTIKTLIQVAELTGAEDSDNNQKIVVEIEDEWTQILVNRIIAHKEKISKCNIVTVPVNIILGQMLSQFSIMPELNLTYSELFSNRGASFFSMRMEPGNDQEYVEGFLENHVHAIPMISMDSKTGHEFYYLCDHEYDMKKATLLPKYDKTVKLTPDYWMKKKNIIILGHNSKIQDIMSGFDRFSYEWNFNTDKLIAENGGRDILNISIIDENISEERKALYKSYSYVKYVRSIDIFEQNSICTEINRILEENEGDTSILILSDDETPREEQDTKSLTYLIYVQDIVSQKQKEIKNFDVESIDIIVEILNPKNYDIVQSYSVDNIVISNRYISKMITQIGEKEDIYEFYNDILTYDEEGCEEYVSMELYAKEVNAFFQEIPEKMSAAELIRAVYHASPDDNKSMAVGYVSPGAKMVLFSGDQTKIPVELHEKDKIILFSNH